MKSRGRLRDETPGTRPPIPLSPGGATRSWQTQRASPLSGLHSSGASLPGVPLRFTPGYLPAAPFGARFSAGRRVPARHIVGWLVMARQSRDRFTHAEKRRNRVPWRPSFAAVRCYRCRCSPPGRPRHSCGCGSATPPARSASSRFLASTCSLKYSRHPRPSAGVFSGDGPDAVTGDCALPTTTH